LTWTKRSANAVARSFAHLAFVYLEKFWLEDAPFQVATFINKDVMLLSTNSK